MRDEIIKTFCNKKIRVKIINGEPYFCGADVGEVLELKNVQRQIRRLPEKGRTISPTPTQGGIQDIIYINESNLYRLIFKSKKKESLKFQEWVTDEVLPSIRKTGKYSIPEKLKKESIESRNILTDSWKECGITKPHEYINLTLQEYKSLGFEKGKRKKDLDKGETLLLSALESMEALNLFHDPQEGYYNCKESLINTADNITKQIKHKNKSNVIA